MNFLFVDRIFEFEPKRSAKGIKHVTTSDLYLKIDREGRSILSSCIIGEALGQLTAWVVMEACDFSKRPVAGIADEVRMHRDVYLGETLLLHTEIEAMDDQSVLYNSYATVCGETVFSLRHAVGPLLPMEDFIDTAQAREQFNMIFRPGTLSPNVISAPNLMLPEVVGFGEGELEDDCDGDRNLEYLEGLQFLEGYDFYDHILDLNTQSMTAQKNISLLAPYFVDHFPRKPVLPLSLLLDGNLELTHLFLRRTLGEMAEYYRLTRLHKIRIKQFILPGDSIVTVVHLKEKSKQGFLFSCKTQVDDKTVCSLEAVFEPNPMTDRHALEVSQNAEKI